MRAYCSNFQVKCDDQPLLSISPSLIEIRVSLLFIVLKVYNLFIIVSAWVALIGEFSSVIVSSISYSCFFLFSWPALNYPSKQVFSEIKFESTEWRLMNGQVLIVKISNLIHWLIVKSHLKSMLALLKKHWTFSLTYYWYSQLFALLKYS